MDYSKNLIKKFKFWTLSVHGNQEYLGRCVLWCNRENALDLVDITKEEMNEFLFIIKNLKKAIEKSFNSDWINYSFLGNSEPHLHCHFVPRYKSERTFENTVFTDKRWGKNWLLDEDFITPENILQKIKNIIAKNLII